MPAILMLIAVLAAGQIGAAELCTKNVDILFIVDGSSDICGNNTSCPEWNYILQFIQSVSANFPIGPDATQIGLIKYGTTVTTEFNLVQYTDLVSLSVAILDILQPGGELIYIGFAIIVLTDQFNPLAGDRLAVPDIAIVITNGMKYYPPLATGTISKLFQLTAGAKFFVVCTRPGCTDATAQNIASPPKAPNTQTYFYVDNYASLNNQVSDALSHQVCLMAEACYNTILPGLCPIPLLG